MEYSIGCKSEADKVWLRLSVICCLLPAASPAASLTLRRKLEIERPAGDEHVPNARAVQKTALGHDHIRDLSLLDRAELIAGTCEPRSVGAERLERRVLRQSAFLHR